MNTATSIIDASFSGLTSPLQVIHAGRPDLADRPGDALIALVSGFARDGGFRGLAEARHRRHAEEAEPVTRVEKVYAPVDRNISRWLEGDLESAPGGTDLD